MDDGSVPRRAVRGSIRWLLAESLVVALGVFAALIAEGWRQAASERAAETRALAALSTEFVENRTQLERQFEVYEKRGAAVAEIIRLMAGAALPRPDSLDRLFRWSLRTGSYDPSNGTLNATLASGDLQLIQDAGLRRLLSRWPAEVANFGELETFYNDIILQHLRPRLRATVGLPSGMGENDFPPNSSPVDLGSALGDSVLEQVLRELHGYSVVLTEGTPARKLEGLLSEIQEALPSQPLHEAGG